MATKKQMNQAAERLEAANQQVQSLRNPQTRAHHPHYGRPLYRALAEQDAASRRV
jgi:hypothetical protein